MSKTLEDKFSELLKLANVDISNVDQDAVEQSKRDVDKLIADDFKNKQEEAKQKRFNKVLVDAQIDPSWTIENLLDSKMPQGVDLRQEFLKFFNSSYTNQSLGLCLFGEYGTGKSHFAGAIAHKYIESEKSAAFFNANHIFEKSRIAKNFKFDKQDEWDQLRQACIDVELLVVDELNTAEKQLSISQAQALGEIIRERHKLGRPCIFISNTSFDHWQNKFGTYLMESIKHYNLMKVPFRGKSLR